MKRYVIIVLTPEGVQDQYCYITEKEIQELKSSGYKILEIEEVLE